MPKGATLQPRGASMLTEVDQHRTEAAPVVRRVPIPFLFDLTSLTDAAGGPADATWLADFVQRSAGPHHDIRVLAQGSHQHLGLLGDLANRLRSDVYFAGPGVQIIIESGDHVAVDSSTGERVPWALIRPDGVATDAPAWFDRIDGRIRPRTGLVTLRVAGGLALPTRRTFLDMATFVTRARHCPRGLTPVAAVVQHGQFAIGWYGGTEALLGGEDFARLLTANIEPIQRGIRLCITWPGEADERRSLDAELQRMADGLGRHVWVPQQRCRAGVVPGLSAPAAMDRAGLPAAWIVYAPAGSTSIEIGYGTDSSGLLVPARPDEPEAEPPVPSVGPASAWWQLGADHRDVLQAADAALRQLRFDRPGEAAALCRVSQAWAEYLAEYERVQHTTMGGTGDVRRVLELRSFLGDVIEAATHVDGVRPEVEMPQSGDQPPQWPSVCDNPAVRAIARLGVPHQVAWLPPMPAANAEPVDLYVSTSLPPGLVAAQGLPTADCFVFAHLDPRRLAARMRSGYLLRLKAPPGAAVAVSRYAHFLPAPLQHRAREASDIFLIPVTWLASTRIVTCFELDGTGELLAEHAVADSGLTVSFKGADHGVPGLPNGAVRWPTRRRPTTAFMSIPDDPEWIRSRLTAFPGWLPLHHTRPNSARGYLSLEVDPPRRAAIDVPETLAQLSHAPIAESSLAAFTGVDLVLPSRMFRKTTIVNVHASGWRLRSAVRHPLIGRPLTDALPAGVWSDTSGHPVVTLDRPAQVA